MQKIKKPISILLSVLMVLSVFAVVPFTASAANLTGTVDMSELKVGDIITVDVTITNNNGYQLKLPSGKIYCESFGSNFYMDVLDHDVILTSYSFSEGWSGGIELKDNTANNTTYYPVDKYGGYGGSAFIVSAVDSDSSTVTIETPTSYTVRWKNYDGNVLQEQDVIKGETPSHPDITPTKPADANYVYTFSGWSPELSPVTADTIYTAQFTSSPIPSDYQSPAISSLWVGDSAEVTATGVINGTGGTGTASVSQEGDYTVLTLDNFSYTGVGSTYDNSKSPVIYLGNYPLIVRLIGTNVLTQTGTTDGDNSYGFYNSNYSSNVVEVRFEGSGKLTVSSGDSEHNTVGVQTGGRLTLSECTLNAKAGSTDYNYATSAGVSSEGDTVIENGAKLTAAGGSVVGDNPISNGANAFSYMWGTADIILKSGSVSLSGETSAIYYGDDENRDYIRVADGSTLKALKAGDSEGSAVDVALDAIANQKYIYAEVDAPASTTYTVTWKNWNGDILKTDTDVAEGTTPTYNGTTPEKAEDENNTYTFSGWKNGTNTYGKDETLPAVTGDITYTATYTATEKSKKLITGQSITLDGNIGINFYLDPAAAGLTVDQVTADNLSYTFAWADDVSAKGEVSEQSGSTFVKDGDLIKVTCKVCAAEMTCGVNATFTLKGITESKESKTYSVREYADTILSDGTQPEALKELIKAMLNYGAMAQTKFKVNLGYLANKNVTFAKGDVTDDMLETAIAAANGTEKADNMNDVAAQHGAKWYSTSLIYLDNNTIRHYFVKENDAFDPSDYPENKANYYYYVQKTDIPAAELDNLQTFTVGNENFKYSALDFVKGMINSSADGDSKNLAKALYWYNQAANKYFDAPAPAENIVDLSTLQGDYEAQNGDVLTGILSGEKQITIADGATVTLKNAEIAQDFSADSAGITLLGDATILLEGTNTVMGGYGDRPGIYVPANTTLTIDGDGSLTASGQDYGSGIGGGYGEAAGNIVINGGTITANGGEDAAGIGSGYMGSCGNITIANTVKKVTAEAGGGSPNSIGAGSYASCGTVTIGGEEGAISTSPYTYQP